MSARPFMDVLREHRAGRTHDDLTDELQKIEVSTNISVLEGEPPHPVSAA